MNWEQARRIRYGEFESAVRQYEPIGLLRDIAGRSSQTQEFLGFSESWGRLAPWTLSGLARASIMTSNRNRSKLIDERGFWRIAALFEQIETTPSDRFELVPFLLGKAHEQSPYQFSAKENLIRTILLLETKISYKEAKSAGDWAELLHVPLEDAAVSTLAVHAVARENGGVFNREVIRQLYSESIHDLAPVESFMGTLDRLTATLDEARVDALAAPQLRDGWRKYGYNPLVKTPLINIGDGVLCAPQTQWVLRSFSPENLYYLGWKKWKGDFGTELGYRVEAYTGDQLNHSGQLEVLPEIRWGKANGKLSVDWFLITPTATILIECKSARTTLNARAGDPTAVRSISQKLEAGFRQIDTTHDEIISGNSSFAAIPRDRPIIGLLITAEPCYLANTTDIRAALPETKIPILAASLPDIEHLATLPGEVLGDIFVRIVNDPELMTYDLSNSIRQLFGENYLPPRNELIDAAYLKYVMPERLIK
ncbi:MULTISPECIES: hypothetical protein [Arthrobacter]|uniref:NERD domain-containing protein n=1 Tax=Arthrobacter terricola TaxID=2547396 RepID=A0A4R5KFA4_9MICC|nr:MULTISPECIES: hypothetical protein [Arthrobacter]MBT8162594.1 hypothetical protein [Arthrobacter sp. GN70]TDF92850.1 hypothetical protein E1809_16960 [Arthrobacter terricola]